MFLKKLCLALPIVLMFALVTHAHADSIECPVLKYQRVESTDGWPADKIFMDDRVSVVYGNQYCYYEKKIKVSFGWVESYQDPESLKKHCKIMFINPSSSEYSVTTSKKYRTLTVSSNTHLAHIQFKLSRKEFSEKNQPYWIDLGERLIGESIRRGLSCEAYKDEIERDRYNAYSDIPEWQNIIEKKPKVSADDTPSESFETQEDYDEKISDIINKIKTKSK